MSDKKPKDNIENNEQEREREEGKKPRKKLKIKKGFKIFLIIILILLGLMASTFIIWLIKPTTNMYVAILDKTVPATAADSYSYLDDVDNVFRKHIGLNWILNYQKIRNPETHKEYDYAKDYYGNMLDNSFEIIDETSLGDAKEIPDLLYLSDAYGVEIYDNKGITQSEMNFIAMAHSMGSVVIGEQSLMTAGETDEGICSQLENLFGIKQTGWVGRYIYDLADLTDVPYWAPPMYKEKYGVEWRCSGSGILLVSDEGDILVFEGKEDFKDDNLLKIYTTDDFHGEFGKHSVNYYAWFELIEATEGTDTIAEFEFNFNKDGMERFAPVSDNPVFAAVVRNKSDRAPSYYFAGDFNDYVDDFNISCFMGADLFYRLLSFDRDGDVTHFYWDFYEPMVKKIIKETKADALVEHNSDGNGSAANAKPLMTRLSDNKLQILKDDEWQDMTIKGLNLKAEAPGDVEGVYSSDFGYYKELISQLDNMGANAVRTYDLYPPEFYRALYEHNKAKDANIIYLFQGIKTSSGISSDSLTSDEALKEQYAKIENTVKAIHGNAEITVDGVGTRYYHDMSQYLCGYFLDTGLETEQLTNLAKSSDYKFDGKYLSADKNSAEALTAALCDHLMSCHKETFDSDAVVISVGDTSMLGGALWQENNSVTYNLSDIKLKSDDTAAYFAVAYRAKYSDKSYQNSKKKLKNYDGYLAEIIKNSSKPVFIESLGASTCANVFDGEKDVYGLSENEQAEQIISMSKSVMSGGFVGGFIADLNDSWSTVGADNYKITVPFNKSGMWHDVTDLDQTSGVLSVDSKEPNEVEMSLEESNQRMSGLTAFCNETYMYITISLDTAVDFDKEEFIVGFDTYERNKGEYYYDKNYFGNALSGMEFVIKFDSNKSANLYCTKAYDRNRGKLTTAESYDASYDLMAVLSYGSFSSQNTQFFTTGNTVRIRIPWAMLNVTDPSQKLVINDASGKIGENGQYKTTITNGVICSVFIGEKKSKDTMYVFPSDKQSPGYKVYKWREWEKENITYQINEKAAANKLKLFFESIV